jgi:pinin/SDK/memA protein
VVPDQDPPTTSTSLKRRQSELTESPIDAKRTRLSPDDQREALRDEQQVRSPQANTAVENTQPDVDNDSGRSTRRKAGREEEKKRGQRMFGALLGALSAKGNSSSTAAKRRADIEKRQAEKLKQLEQDVNQREREQAEELMRTRRKEQWVVDAAAVSSIEASLVERS